MCSGALIGADAVLTAAHCVFGRDGDGGGVRVARLLACQLAVELNCCCLRLACLSQHNVQETIEFSYILNLKC